MSGLSRERIIKGPVVRTLLWLGWPVMLTEFLHMAYSLADTFWLGHLGGDEGRAAVATLQISWPVIMVLISLGLGLGMGGVALVSQYRGAGLKDEANRSAGQLISVMIIFSILIAIVGYPATPLILNLLGLGESISQGAILYTRIILLGMPFEFIAFGIESIFRAYGDTKTPMKVIGLAVTLNIILDPILIFGYSIFPRMGILGAAVATLISYGFAGFIGLYLLFSGMFEIKVKKKDLRPIRDEFSRIAKIGLPASIGQAGSALGFFILMYIIAQIPDAEMVLSAYGIGNRIINLDFVIIWGLGAACTTMIGQSLGADRADRAREVTRKTLMLIFSLLSLTSFILYLLRYQAVSIFIVDDPEVVKEGAHFLAIFLVGIPFFGVFQAANSVFQGSGHNIPVMVAALARLLVLRVPLSYLLGIYLGWGPTGIWTGMALSNFAAAFIGLALLSTGVWKKRVIKETSIGSEMAADPEDGNRGWK